MTSRPPTRLSVFVDYENVRHGARSIFGSPSTDSPTMGHVHPDLLGELLCQRGQAVDTTRSLTAVHVYRGRPGRQSHRNLRVSFDRQTARWAKMPGVIVKTSNMRYEAAERDPNTGEVTRWAGQGKGIDVLLALDLVRGARDDAALP